MCHMTIDYEDCSRFIKEKLHIDLFPYQEIMLKAFCDDLEVRTGRAIGRSFVADAFGLDFWDLLAEFETPESRTVLRLPEENYTPAAKVSTGEYLGAMDDDRAWWWKPGGNICFSAEMNGWLEERREELRELAWMETIGSPELMRLLVDTLCCIQEDWNTMAFSGMFYDFLAHAEEPVVQAAVRSIGRLAQECREKPADGLKWLRRYLAVLGNFDLRREVFGF